MRTESEKDKEKFNVHIKTDLLIKNLGWKKNNFKIWNIFVKCLLHKILGSTHKLESLKPFFVLDENIIYSFSSRIPGCLLSLVQKHKFIFQDLYTLCILYIRILKTCHKLLVRWENIFRIYLTFVGALILQVYPLTNLGKLLYISKSLLWGKCDFLNCYLR